MDKSRYFINGFSGNGELGYFSYESPHLMKNTFGYNFSEKKKSMFNYKIDSKAYVRDVVVLKDGQITIITSDNVFGVLQEKKMDITDEINTLFN